MPSTHFARIQTSKHTWAIAAGVALSWGVTAWIIGMTLPRSERKVIQAILPFLAVFGIYIVPIYFLPRREILVDERGISAGGLDLRWEEIKKIGLIPDHIGLQIRIKSSKGTVKLFWRRKHAEERNRFRDALYDESPPNWWIDHVKREEE